MEKAKMNQDQLYQYMLAHNITIKRLGELIGLSDVVMSQAFKHHIVNGKPHYFVVKKLQLINEALPCLADEIAARLLVFHPENNISTIAGRCYDPSCVEQLRQVGNYFNIKGLTGRVLGWKESKKEAVFNPSNKGYGHITLQEVTELNTELLSVVGVLRATEVVPDKGDSGF